MIRKKADSAAEPTEDAEQPQDQLHGFRGSLCDLPPRLESTDYETVSCLTRPGKLSGKRLEISACVVLNCNATLRGDQSAD